MFNDRKVVNFVFPEHMLCKVARAQCDGTFGYQSVPPLLPAYNLYNKFMGAVDLVSQVRKPYGFDRRSKRYWLRLFFQFLDYAVNIAYLLYKHDCRRLGMKYVSRRSFRSALIDQLCRKSPVKRSQSRVAPASAAVRCSCIRHRFDQRQV